jgi:hypothetical protein
MSLALSKGFGNPNFGSFPYNQTDTLSFAPLFAMYKISLDASQRLFSSLHYSRSTSVT